MLWTKAVQAQEVTPGGTPNSRVWARFEQAVMAMQGHSAAGREPYIIASWPQLRAIWEHTASMQRCSQLAEQVHAAVGISPGCTSKQYFVVAYAITM